MLPPRHYTILPHTLCGHKNWWFITTKRSHNTKGRFVLFPKKRCLLFNHTIYILGMCMVYFVLFCILYYQRLEESRHMFNSMLRITFMNASCEIALRWMPQNTFDDKSTLVQEMACCRQATRDLCHGNAFYSPFYSPFDSPRCGKLVTGSFSLQMPSNVMIISLLLGWTECWTICRSAVDIRRHGAHVSL